jgi:hypothetical protein
MNVRGRVQALREFRTGSSMLTVLKIHEYRSLQLNVKEHISVFCLYRLFSCSRYRLICFYSLCILSRCELVANNKFYHPPPMSARLQISTKYSLFMHRSFSLFFSLCFYAIENHHFCIVILGHLMLNYINSLNFFAGMHKICI